PGDHRAVDGLGDVHADRRAAADRDFLGPGRGGQPFTAVEVARRFCRVELLDVQVVDVGHGVGDAPGHVLVVPEVREPGDAGHGEADRVELIAAQVHLRVHAGQL